MLKVRPESPDHMRRIVEPQWLLAEATNLLALSCVSLSQVLQAGHSGYRNTFASAKEGTWLSER